MEPRRLWFVPRSLEEASGEPGLLGTRPPSNPMLPVDRGYGEDRMEGQRAGLEGRGRRVRSLKIKQVPRLPCESKGGPREGTGRHAHL